MEAGRIAAGSGRAGAPHRASAMGTPLRLDPFSLPVRFAAADEAADERLRIVDLHRERVVLRRSVRGMRMALSMPVAAFRGVAIRLVGEADKTEQDPTAIAVVLEHGDPALSLPLFASTESDDIVAEWQAWGRVLGLPLLIAEARRQLARAVRAAWRVAHRGADMAPPPAQRHRAPPARETVAPPPGRLASAARRPSRRTRDHRQRLSLHVQAAGAGIRPKAPPPMRSTDPQDRRPAFRLIGAIRCDRSAHAWARATTGGLRGPSGPWRRGSASRPRPGRRRR